MKAAIAIFAITCWMCCQLAVAGSTFDVGGRMDLDFAEYDEDETRLESGVNLRRLRLELGGDLTEKLSLYTMADFSDEDYGAQASWLRYRFSEQDAIYAGRIEIPFSLQRVTNSQYNLLPERALPAALTSHYGTGLVYMHKGSRWGWRVGLFGDDRLNFGGSKEAGTTLAARAGRRLHWGESRIWLGASAMYQDTTEPERFRSRPESSVTGAQLVNTGRISDVAKTGRLGLEGVWKKDRWAVQGEWIHFAGDRSGAEDVIFSGGYIEASRMINGRRRFNFSSGEWMSPEIGRRGAWELAVRISWIDLEDGAISGGKESNYSFGLNYYINPINRVMLNWIKADAHPNRNGVDESPSILQLRLQLGF